MESTVCRKTYVSVNVDQKRCVYPRYIRWENGLVFLIDRILYKCCAASQKVGDGGIRYTVWIFSFANRNSMICLLQWAQGGSAVSLPYTALDLADLLRLRDLGAKEEAALLDKMWEEEQAFLSPDLKKSKRIFLLDVAYWSLYLREKPYIGQEFPVIQRDVADCGACLSQEAFLSDFSDLDLYFKEVRFCLRFFSDCGYVRIKLRTLLKQYGYRRRSAKLLEHLEQCMVFYHLQPYLRGGIPCKLSEIPVDEMIIFRLLEETDMQ